MPIISLPSFFILLTNSMGSMPLSKALLNCFAAASRAPPKRSPWNLGINHVSLKEVFFFPLGNGRTVCVSSTDDGEQARGEAWDEVLPSTSTDYGVVCTRDSRPMIRSHHQAHLNELAGIAWQPTWKYILCYWKYTCKKTLLLSRRLTPVVKPTCVETKASQALHLNPSPLWRPQWWACQRRWAPGLARHRCLSWMRLVYGSGPTPAGNPRYLIALKSTSC